jgi:hypothetical protein
MSRICGAKKQTTAHSRAPMDSYLRTETQLAPEAQRESTPDEMRITTQGKIRNYITYANALFTVSKRGFTIVTH